MKPRISVIAGGVALGLLIAAPAIAQTSTEQSRRGCESLLPDGESATQQSQVVEPPALGVRFEVPENYVVMMGEAESSGAQSVFIISADTNNYIQCLTVNDAPGAVDIDAIVVLQSEQTVEDFLRAETTSGGAVASNSIVGPTKVAGELAFIYNNTRGEYVVQVDYPDQSASLRIVSNMTGALPAMEATVIRILTSLRFL